MPVNPSILQQQGTPAQIRGPVDRLTRRIGLENMLGEQDAKKASKAKAVQIQQAIMAAGGDVEAALPSIMSIDATIGSVFQTQLQSRKSSQATIAKTEQDIAASKAGVLDAEADNLLNAQKLMEDARKTAEAERIARETAARPKMDTVPKGHEYGYLDPQTNQWVKLGTAASDPPTPPANVGEYNFYAKQESDAGRTPKSFEEWQRSSVRQPVPVVLQTSEGPQILNRSTGTTSVIRNAAGETVQPAPTTDMRNREESLKRIDPIVGAIDELSNKINTQEGVVATISGAVEKQKAKVNLNDDIAEYESVISGFTPMIARAVGHTGVLTEQDVQSVRSAFPKPGDSKSLRDRQMARFKSILYSDKRGQLKDVFADETTSEYERGPDGRLRLKQ